MNTSLPSRLVRSAGPTVALLAAALILVGCNRDGGVPADAARNGQAASAADGDGAQDSPKTASTGNKPDSGIAAGEDFQPIRLSGANDGDTAEPASLNPEERRQRVMQALSPFQVLVGAWRGTTKERIGDFAAIDDLSWRWDFTEPAQPALVMTSDASPYFRQARLTYDLKRRLFLLETEDDKGEKRRFEGRFASPPKLEPGDDGKTLQQTYKVEFTETAPARVGQSWQLLVNQQNNNRYLLVLSRRLKSGALRQIDIVATQRQGTSFAISQTGYGERTCVVSGGLGTIQVSYQGRTYWVCCTGCKAVFEDDPEFWLSKRRQADGGSP